jgi:hypothetical protein
MPLLMDPEHKDCLCSGGGQGFLPDAGIYYCEQHARLSECPDTIGGMMFNYDYDLGPGRWLKWFMAAMIIYAISTCWPDNEWVVRIGLAFAAIGISMAKRQIKRGRD